MFYLQTAACFIDSASLAHLLTSLLDTVEVGSESNKLSIFFFFFLTSIVVLFIV